MDESIEGTGESPDSRSTEDPLYAQTALDQMVGDEVSQLLKAAIPYLPARHQQIVSIYAKARELSNAVSLFSPEGDTVRIQAQSEEPVDSLEMLKDIQRFCYGNSKSMLTQAINLISMLRISQLF
jgi:hypothetical protein